MLNLKNKNINLQINIDHNLCVYSDNQMLRTVLRNLLSNAIKFTHNNGEIEISAIEAENGFIEIKLKDSGVGISKENLEHLFDFSNPLRTFGTNNETGSGLGLILCTDFIQKSNGTLSVESEVGVGSTFTFTLPKCDSIE
jgi:two-component system sensor histidine kinase/response regulator